MRETIKKLLIKQGIRQLVLMPAEAFHLLSQDGRGRFTDEDIENILTHNDTSILLASDLYKLLHDMKEEKQLVETRYPTLYYLNTPAGKDALRRRIAAAGDENTKERFQEYLQRLEQEPSAHENDDDPCLPKDELIDAETTCCVTVHNGMEALE